MCQSWKLGDSPLPSILKWRRVELEKGIHSRASIWIRRKRAGSGKGRENEVIHHQQEKESSLPQEETDEGFRSNLSQKYTLERKPPGLLCAFPTRLHIIFGIATYLALQPKGVNSHGNKVSYSVMEANLPSKKKRQNLVRGRVGTGPGEEQPKRSGCWFKKPGGGETRSKGDKPFDSCQAPPFPASFSLTNSQETLLCGEPTSSLQEDQLKSHQSHFESLIGHLEGIFFCSCFLFLSHSFYLSYFCLTFYSTPLLCLIRARNFFIKSLYSAITTFTIHEVAPPEFLSLSMCLEADFCSSRFTEHLSSFQTQT